MMWVRSLAFYAAFYSWALFCGILFLPALILPRPVALKVSKMWVRGILWQCKHTLGICVRVNGKENLRTHPAIIASKHQSAWETFFLHHLIADPIIVLKQELLWIPVLGWYLNKLGMIGLSRSKRKNVQDLKILLKKASVALSHSRQILIFPEGTRSKPGEKGKYQTGITSLYQHLKVPVIPVAHNAGLFWPRRGFLKRPGTITVDILAPIQPGLSRKEFMGILENKIETTSNNLIHEGCAYAKKT